MTRTKEHAQAISAALKGKPKTLETRAAMAASRAVNRQQDPLHWQYVYSKRLRELRKMEQVRGILLPA